MSQRLAMGAALALALSAGACAEAPEDAAEAAVETEVAAVQPEAAAQAEAEEAGFDFPEDAWRDMDPENTLYIETDYGRVVIELAPEFAPNHVDRMKTLARHQFYDFLIWHRVIDGFMAQGGGSRSNPNHGTDLPDMDAEFTISRGGDFTVSELQDRVVNPRSVRRMAKAGFWNGFHAGTDPIAAAALTVDGQVSSWLLHCEGAASMARTNDPNSAGSQFYVTRSNADHLNSIYTVWGRVRSGQEAINSLRVGTVGQDMGFTPDVIRSMRVAADLPEDERTVVQVADTEHAAFGEYLDTLRNADGSLPDICQIDVPTRTVD
jgi:peptidylprolyl isomerase